MPRSRVDYAPHMEVEGAIVPHSYRIFLSYSRVDKWVLRNYIEPLRLIDGVDVFYDGDIRPGEPFPERIVSTLLSVDEFLVVLSPSSTHRPWVLVEIGMAIAKGIPIIPILHSYTKEEALRSPVGEFLGQRQHIDGPEEFDDYLSTLRARCSGGGDHT